MVSPSMQSNVNTMLGKELLSFLLQGVMAECILYQKLYQFEFYEP